MLPLDERGNLVGKGNPAAQEHVGMTQASIRKLCQQFYETVLEKLRNEDPDVGA